MNTPSPNPLPQGGEGFSPLNPLPVGEGRVRAFLVSLKKKPLRRPKPHNHIPTLLVLPEGEDRAQGLTRNHGADNIAIVGHGRDPRAVSRPGHDNRAGGRTTIVDRIAFQRNLAACLFDQNRGGPGIDLGLQPCC